MPSVQSVLGQSYQDFELLVIGDSCTDETESVLSPFLSEKVRWLNLNDHGGGQSFPNNAGIESANGANIAYVGHDDIWHKDHLEALNALWAAEPDLDFAISGAIYHMPPGVSRPQVTGIFDDERAKFTHFFPPSSFAHARHVIAKIGAWHDPMQIRSPVDVDLLLRAAHAGCRFRSTKKITVHKFAAGHRHLSYVYPNSQEQEEILRHMKEPSFDKYVDDLVECSRQLGSYMALRYEDFERFEPGQLAKENAARKGALRPPLKRLSLGELVPQENFKLAWDWSEKGSDGLRWAGLNPRPKLLFPFTADNAAAVQMIIAHSRAEALQHLTFSIRGSLHEAGVGRLFRVSDHWEAVANLSLELAKDDYTVIELNLENGQITLPGARGIGIGDIFINSDAIGHARRKIAEEMYFTDRIRAVEVEQQLQAELKAVLAERDRLSSDLAALIPEKNLLSFANEKLRGKLDTALTERDVLSSKAQGSKSDVAAFIAYKERLYSENERLRSKLGAIRGSTLWKAARFLRRLHRFSRLSRMHGKMSGA